MAIPRANRRRRETEVVKPAATVEPAIELKTQLSERTDELIDAVNSADLANAAEAGEEIHRTMIDAERKGLVDHESVTEVQEAANELELAAATGDEAKANEAAQAVVDRADAVVAKDRNYYGKSGYSSYPSRRRQYSYGGRKRFRPSSGKQFFFEEEEPIPEEPSSIQFGGEKQFHKEHKQFEHESRKKFEQEHSEKFHHKTQKEFQKQEPILVEEPKRFQFDQVPPFQFGGASSSNQFQSEQKQFQKESRRKFEEEQSQKFQQETQKEFQKQEPILVEEPKRFQFDQVPPFQFGGASSSNQFQSEQKQFQKESRRKFEEEQSQKFQQETQKEFQNQQRPRFINEPQPFQFNPPPFQFPGRRRSGQFNDENPNLDQLRSAPTDESENTPKHVDRYSMNEKSAIEKFKATMRAMRHALREQRLYLAAQHAKNAAETAHKLTPLDRTNDADIDREIDTLAEGMDDAAINGNVEVAEQIVERMDQISSEIAPDNRMSDEEEARTLLFEDDRIDDADRNYHYGKHRHNNKRIIIIRERPSFENKRYYEYAPRLRKHRDYKGRLYYRGDDNENDRVYNIENDDAHGRSEDVEKPTQAELKLANMAGAVESTEMNIKQSRMEEALETVEEADKYTQEAVEAEAIAPEKAVTIQKSVEVVKVAAQNGDQEAALENVRELQNQVDEAMVSQKGEEVAENLKYAEENQDKPVLSTPEDEETLEAVVDELIDSDDLVPEEDKEEAKQYTVDVMKQGLKEAETTNGEVIAEVEENSPAVQDMESMDRDYYTDHRKYSRRRYHYRPRYYHPYYHPYYPRYSYYPYYKRYHRGYGRRYHGRHHHKKHHGKSYYRDDEEELNDEEDRASYSSSSYAPYYYRGYGFRQCLYYNSYRYCLRRLMKDYAYQQGFYNFYRRPRYYQHSKY